MHREDVHKQINNQVQFQYNYTNGVVAKVGKNMAESIINRKWKTTCIKALTDHTLKI